MVKPATKREVVNYLVSEYAINIRQACKSLNLERSSYYYHSQRKEDTELIGCLNELSEKHPSYGFKKMFHSLRNQGFLWKSKIRRSQSQEGISCLQEAWIEHFKKTKKKISFKREAKSGSSEQLQRSLEYGFYE